MLGATLAVWLGSGCNVGTLDEEYSLTDCSDDEDNDLDSLVDCDEPTCRVYAYCRPGEGAAGTGSLGTPEDRDDKPPPVQCQSELACGPAQDCVNNYCVPRDVGVFELETIYAQVPRATGLIREYVTCLNASCSVASPPHEDFPDCPCPPDPFAIIEINDSLTATTDVRRGSETPTWAAPGNLRFTPGSLLRFELRDFGAGGASTIIYACTAAADSAAYANGVVSCSHDFYVFGDGPLKKPFGVTATLRQIDRAD